MLPKLSEHKRDSHTIWRESCANFILTHTHYNNNNVLFVYCVTSNLGAQKKNDWKKTQAERDGANTSDRWKAAAHRD